MCGRFRLATPAEVLAQLLGLAEVPDVEPRYNIAPTQPVGIVRVHAQTSGREWANVRWGLVPHWSKQPLEGPLLFNARGESVATRPAFRDAFRKRRCLIPADGFYEWKAPGSGMKKRAYFIHMPDEHPFAFAGLWDRCERGLDRPIESCTIITTEPNDVVRELHNRMPVILTVDDYARWLDPAQPADVLQGLLVPFAGELSALPAGPLPAV
jgi:putative SOS response-associated peptidase YedK